MNHFKTIISLFIILMFLPVVSALEIDNIGKYNEETKTMEVINLFGFGSSIANITLLSPLNVVVGHGEEVLVAWFEIDNFGTYNGNSIFSIIDTYDLKRGNSEIQKNIVYKKQNIDVIQVPKYIESCSPSGNETNCILVEDGTEDKEVIEWKSFNINSDLLEGKVVIGLFTEVEPRENVEWIPEMFGVRIDEWAEWTSNLNEGLIAYWNFDEGGGSVGKVYVDNVTGKYNFTSFIGTMTTETGKINSAIGMPGSSQMNFTMGEEFDLSNGLTISGWVKMKTACVGSCGTQILATYDTPIPDGLIQAGVSQTDDADRFSYQYNGTDTIIFHDWIVGTWVYATEVWNTTDVIIYKDGVVFGGNRDTNSTGNLDGNYMRFGMAAGSNFIYDEWGYWNRSLTASEITTLYNDGDGLTFNPLPLRVNLNLPINFLNTSDSNIEFNCSATAGNNLQNISLIIDGIINETKISGTSLFIELNKTVQISEGDHAWDCRASDTLVPSNQGISNTRNFTIDSTKPDINITHPPDILDYHLKSTNLTFNWTIVEPNLESCLLEYEGINISVGCLDNNASINITNFVNKSITFCANDTTGNSNCTTKSWDYYVFEHNQTFSNQTTEGNSETFIAILQNSVLITQSDLFYNGTNNVGENFAIEIFSALRKQNLIIPGVTADIKVPFYWQITFSDGNKVNMSSQNQTIFNLNLDNCTTNTNVIMNFTVIDEELQTILDNNAIIETSLNIFSKDRSELIVSFADLKNTNQTKICLNRDLQNSTIYSLDSIVRYEHPLYANEYYNIVNFSLTINTSIQDILLFDLNITDSTEFQLTFDGTDFLPVENALVFVDRQYISENVFKTVEIPKTDSNGQTILHLVRNDVIYNMVVSKDGVVLGNFQNIRAFCEDFTIGRCTLSLNALSNASAIFDYGAAIGITATSPPTFNETSNSVSFSFISNDGSVKNIFMNVTRKDVFGNTSLCSNSIQTSSGTVTCVITEELVDTSIFTTITIDGETWILDESVAVDTSGYGSMGYFVWFILTLVMVLALSESKNGIMMALMISYMGAIALGIALGGITGIGSSGIWMILITLVGIWQINRNRKS